MPDAPYYPSRAAEGEVGAVDFAHPYGSLPRYGGVREGATPYPADPQLHVMNMVKSAAALGINAHVPRGRWVVTGTTETSYATLDGDAPEYATPDVNVSRLDNFAIEAEPGAVLVAQFRSVKSVLHVSNANNFTIRSLAFGFIKGKRPITRIDPRHALRITDCNDCSMIDVHVDGSSSYGIGFEDCKRPNVRGGSIRNTLADGLNFTRCFAPLADGVTTEYTGDDGIAITTPVFKRGVKFGVDPLPYPLNKAGFFNEGGRVVNCFVRYSASRGIFVSGQSLVVADCTVEYTSNAGIAVFRNTSPGVNDPGLESSSVSIIGGSVRFAGHGDNQGIFTGPEVSPEDDPDGPETRRQRHNGPFWFSGGILVAEASVPPGTDGYPSYTRRHKNISISGVAIEQPYYTAMTISGVDGVTISSCPIDKPRTSNSLIGFAIFVQQCTRVSVGGCPVLRAETVDYAAYVDESTDVSLLPNPSSKPSHVASNCVNTFWHDGRQKLHLDKIPIYSPAAKVLTIGADNYVEANGYRDGDGTPMLTGQLPAIAPVSGVSDAYDYEARVAINNLMQFMKNVHLMAP